MSRPTKFDKSRVKKLEEAFLLGCNVKEACIYAGISKQTYYNWEAENTELFDHFEVLRLSPIFKARRTVIGALEKDVKVAQWYLERKAKDEFGLNMKSDHEDNKIDKIIIQHVGSDTDTLIREGFISA
jgi:hypothetical protein